MAYDPRTGEFDPAQFAQRLRGARIAKGITQAELARLIFKDTKMVDHWEQHGVIPGSDNLFRICVALEVSADELLGTVG